MFEFTIARAASLAAVEPAAKAVATRDTVPILMNLRLTLDGEILSVSGTDLDRQATTTIGIETATGSGATTVPASLLVTILKRGAGDLVHVAVTEYEMVVKIGRSRAKLPTLPASDFSDIRAKAPLAQFAIPGPTLARLIGACAFAMSKEPTRHYLMGICLLIEEGKLTAVAADGTRLALMQAPAPDGAETMPTVILPDTTIALLGAVTSAEVVEIAIAESFAVFSRPGLTIATRLVDGTYPDFRRVIPIRNDNRIRADRAAALACVHRVESFVGATREMALVVSPDSLRFVAASNEGGQAEDTMETDGGAPLVVGFSVPMLASVLASLDGDEVEFALHDPSSPALFADPADPDRFAVLMPYRIGGATVAAIAASTDAIARAA